ncbi:hypothetical protein TNCV_3801061 [Trichonephila clavipes]|nr:hypothetical protein TNCV_3801061 [Trichonephila clavipes]
MSPTGGKEKTQARNIRTRQDPLGPQRGRRASAKQKYNESRLVDQARFNDETGNENHNDETDNENHNDEIINAALIEEFEDLFCSYDVHKGNAKTKLRPTESLFEYFWPCVKLLQSTLSFRRSQPDYVVYNCIDSKNKRTNVKQYDFPTSNKNMCSDNKFHKKGQFNAAAANKSNHPPRGNVPDGTGETKQGTSELDRIRWDPQEGRRASTKQ